MTEGVVLATSKMFAEAISKPEAKCAVQYVPDQIISHGGILGNAAQSKRVFYVVSYLGGRRDLRGWWSYRL